VNGKNGKPLRLKSYERGTLASGKYVVERIVGDSMIVRFSSVSEFRFRADAFDPCDVKDKHDDPPKYSLAEIVSEGVIAPNYCGHIAPAVPKPGELLIYSRREHWWEITARVARGLLICG
jgi:hypothetical protein